MALPVLRVSVRPIIVKSVYIAAAVSISLSASVACQWAVGFDGAAPGLSQSGRSWRGKCLMALRASPRGEYLPARQLIWMLPAA